MNNHFYTQSIQNYTVWHTFIWHLAFCYWFGTVYCLTHVLASIKSSTLTLSAFLSPRSKRKTAWAINTKLGTHRFYSMAIPRHVWIKVKVKVTRLSNTLPRGVGRSTRLPKFLVHWMRYERVITGVRLLVIESINPCSWRMPAGPSVAD